jgi:hypothetical protein
MAENRRDKSAQIFDKKKQQQQNKLTRKREGKCSVTCQCTRTKAEHKFLRKQRKWGKCLVYSVTASRNSESRVLLLVGGYASLCSIHVCSINKYSTHSTIVSIHSCCDITRKVASYISQIFWRICHLKVWKSVALHMCELKTRRRIKDFQQIY